MHQGRALTLSKDNGLKGKGHAIIRITITLAVFFLLYKSSLLFCCCWRRNGTTTSTHSGAVHTCQRGMFPVRLGLRGVVQGLEDKS